MCQNVIICQKCLFSSNVFSGWEEYKIVSIMMVVANNCGLNWLGHICVV